MSSSEEKKHPPSGRKLRKLRKDGSVPNSQDLAGLFSTAAGLLVIALMGSLIWQKMAANIIITSELVKLPFAEALNAAASKMGYLFLLTLLPVLGVVIVVALLAYLAYNKGVLVAMKPLIPKIDRISPVAGVKRIYGKRGWIETAVSLIRITFWLGFVYAVVSEWLPALLASSNCTNLCQSEFAEPLAWFLIIGSVICLLVFASADIIVQQKLFLSEQKMTQSEVKREFKEQSGSAEIKRERNRIRDEARNAPAKTGIEKANMCFFTDDLAVGILYLPPETKVPTIVARAKGKEKALELRMVLNQMNAPEYQHEAITKTAFSSGVGSYLEAKVYTEFAAALQTMFGQ